jgi:hypothetical protein
MDLVPSEVLSGAEENSVELRTVAWDISGPNVSERRKNQYADKAVLLK